jgi:serine/threonine protein kinase
MTDRIGQQFGDYRLIRLLGSGGFGDVYLGQQHHDNTLAAVKILKAQLNAHEIKQFINEARTIRLRHPHIVPLLDFGIGNHDTPFLVMEYAPYGTLRQRHVKGERLPLAKILSYTKQVAGALQYAHDQRLIHRDVKPENMLIGDNEVIMLSDFGLVLVPKSTDAQTLQQMAGTVYYMAPEQIKGKPRPASDQYALGTIVYEWLCGYRPFHGSPMEIATQHVFSSPPPLHERVPTISVSVEQVVLKALAKDSQERFARVEDFALALERAIQVENNNSATLSRTQPSQSVLIENSPELSSTVLGMYNQVEQVTLSNDRTSIQPESVFNASEVSEQQQPKVADHTDQIRFSDYAATPAQPQKKSRLGLWIVLIVIILSGAAVGAAGVGAILYFNRSMPVNRSMPEKTLDAYCNALLEQDYLTAYNQLAASLQKDETESEFANTSRAVGKVSACTHSSANTTGNRVSLIQDSESNNVWKINSIQF